ncbi:hypothetical protein NKG05_16545 [Oerskovia sp. M15]
MGEEGRRGPADGASRLGSCSGAQRQPVARGTAGEEAGPVGEAEFARSLVDDLHRVGAIEVVMDEVEADRSNVYALFPGRTERLVTVDVHTDTVSVEHMTDPPFDGRIEAGHVWGRAHSTARPPWASC